MNANIILIAKDIFGELMLAEGSQLTLCTRVRSDSRSRGIICAAASTVRLDTGGCAPGTGRRTWGVIQMHIIICMHIIHSCE